MFIETFKFLATVGLGFCVSISAFSSDLEAELKNIKTFTFDDKGKTRCQVQNTKGEILFDVYPCPTNAVGKIGLRYKKSWNEATQTETKTPIVLVAYFYSAKDSSKFWVIQGASPDGKTWDSLNKVMKGSKWTGKWAPGIMSMADFETNILALETKAQPRLLPAQDSRNGVADR